MEQPKMEESEEDDQFSSEDIINMMHEGGLKIKGTLNKKKSRSTFVQPQPSSTINTSNIELSCTQPFYMGEDVIAYKADDDIVNALDEDSVSIIPSFFHDNDHDLDYCDFVTQNVELDHVEEITGDMIQISDENGNKLQIKETQQVLVAEKKEVKETGEERKAEEVRDAEAVKEREAEADDEIEAEAAEEKETEEVKDAEAGEEREAEAGEEIEAEAAEEKETEEVKDAEAGEEREAEAGEEIEAEAGEEREADEAREAEEIREAIAGEEREEGERSNAEKDKRVRRKRALPENWKINITKEKRMKGECYSGYSRNKDSHIITTGIQREERKISPTCTSDYCKKSYKRFCDKFSEAKRKEMFQNFWKELDWAGKKAMICSLIDKQPTKQKRCEGDLSRRSETLAYHLKLDNERKQVCKKMFLNTFGLKEGMVLSWTSNNNVKEGIPLMETQKRDSKQGKRKSTAIPNSEGISQRSHLDNFLDSLPKLPSHYCRSTSSKLYLEPLYETKADLFEKYKEKCTEDGVSPVSSSYFLMVFDEMNLSICSPKKDKCDLCCAYETNNVSKEVYDAHIKRKEDARKQKDDNKKLALEGKVTVLSMDVQSVKVVPKVQASAVYYKMKLCCHNYSIYNLATHEVTCYWWNETEGELNASSFASCLIDYLQEKVSISKPLILYSDGCTSQNRNVTMANALLDYAIKNKMSITQKYLEKGHTQMEVDSVHSTIERKLKHTDVYLPHEYINITKDAKKQAPKYEAKYLTHTFFKNYTVLTRYSTIRPGRKTGDPVVTDLREIHYDPDDCNIKYKLNFNDDNYTNLPIRPKPIRGDIECPQMYTARLPIKLRKWKDLQDLKSVIPRDCHSYYDNIPKTEG